MGVTAITSYDQFKDLVNSGDPVVIDFWATWCAPCKVISPVFEKLSDQYQFSGVGFYEVDVDDQTEVSEEAGIKAMPTFVLYKGGNKVGELIGAAPNELQELVQQALN